MYDISTATKLTLIRRATCNRLGCLEPYFRKMRGSVGCPALALRRFASIASPWTTFWAIAPAIVHYSEKIGGVGGIASCECEVNDRARRPLSESEEDKDG